MAVTSGLGLILFVGFWVFVRVMLTAGGLGGVNSYWVPPALRVLPLLGMSLAAPPSCLAVLILRGWRVDRWPRSRRGYFLLATLAALVLLALAAYWNLLGPPF